MTLRFDSELAQLSPREFCSLVLSARLGAREVLVGDNFRFGRGGVGTSDDLAAFGRSHGFSVSVVPLVEEGGRPVSSTRIRDLLAEGEVRFGS